MEVICSILAALFGIGFGIFMALQPEDAIALHDRGRYTQTEPTEAYSKLTRLEGIGLSVLCSHPNNTLQLSSCGFFLILLQ